MTKKEIEFKNAVDDLIKEYKKLGFPFPNLVKMFANNTNNYVDTTKRLVKSFDATSGYIKLLELNRLDLTIESLVADEERWGDLFDKETINHAKRKILSS
jgi:hypothetical protein